MRRFIVTGGAGFVGSHLVERLLSEGNEVLVIDDLSTGTLENLRGVLREPRFHFLEADVATAHFPNAELIFHLACPASPVHYQRDMVRTLMTAAVGTKQALDAAQRCGAKIVIASTSEIYGDPLVHPQREDYWGNVNSVGPRACYDEGKRCAEAFATAYRLQHGVDARLVRIFNTYGPRMCRDDGRVVSNFVYQALTGRPITLYGDGTQTRSFCFVSDLVDGLVRAMFVPHNPGPINLGNPDERSVSELAALILKLTGSTAELIHNPLPVDDPTRRRPDIEKATRLLGWSPVVSLLDGLEATIADARRRITANFERSAEEVTYEGHRTGHRLRRSHSRGNPG
jgi:UDP-glucuronate decarboxylase